jgi:group I intron endonuclease
MKTKGIYAIVCKTTGKRYVGQTAISFASRKRKHIKLLEDGKHHSPKLQNAYNKYGRAQFSFVILERIDASNKVRLNKREQHYMNRTPKSRSLNCRPSAESMLGFKFTGEALIKNHAHIRRLATDPKTRAKNLAHLRKLNSDPEKRSKCIVAAAKRAADPVWRASMQKVWAKMRKRVRSPNWKIRMAIVWAKKRKVAA